MALAEATGMAQDQGPGAGEEVIAGPTINPVSFELQPGQMTAVLSIQNDTDREADFQVRPYAWDQPAGKDELSPTDVLVASPPLGRVSIGFGQVCALFCGSPRRPGKSATGSCSTRCRRRRSRASWALRCGSRSRCSLRGRQATAGAMCAGASASDGADHLVAVNDGSRHDTFRDMALLSSPGRKADRA